MYWLTVLNGSSQSKNIFPEKLKNNLPVLFHFGFFFWAKLKKLAQTNTSDFGSLLEKLSGMGKCMLTATETIFWLEQPRTCPAGWLVRPSVWFTCFLNF